MAKLIIKRLDVRCDNCGTDIVIPTHALDVKPKDADDRFSTVYDCGTVCPTCQHECRFCIPGRVLKMMDDSRPTHHLPTISMMEGSKK